MSRKCELTGKKAMSGNNVSHAKNRTKRKFLPNLKNVSLPYQHPDIQSSWHLFVVQVSDREEVFNKLLKRGVQTQVHYIPVNNQPFYNYKKLENTENFYKNCLSLPIYYDLKDDECAMVVESFNND